MVHRRKALSQDSAGQADHAAPESEVAPRAPAIADLTSLQSTIGNRALARAIQAGRVGASAAVRPTARVLARTTTGLRRSKKVTDFADDALTWWRDPAPAPGLTLLLRLAVDDRKFDTRKLGVVMAVADTSATAQTVAEQLGARA